MVAGQPRRGGAGPQRLNPFQPAQPFPGVVGEGRPKIPKLAMDAADAWKTYAMDDVGAITAGAGWIGGSGQNYYASAYAEGQEWLGYAVLALLAQRPEYRIMVSTVATEMTREWISFKSKSEDKSEHVRKRIEQIEERLRELKFRGVMEAANANDGFQGRGQVYVDTGHPDDRDELRLPLDTTTREGLRAIRAKYGVGKFITRLGAIEPMWCYPAAYEASDPLKADWYKPDLWWVMGKEVSRDRLLTFVGNPVPDVIKPAYSFGGIATTQMAKPYVDFWLRNRTSESDLLNNFSLRVLATDMDVTTADEGSELFDRARALNVMADNQGVLLINKMSEEFDIRQTSLGGVSDITKQSMERLTIPSQMPIVKFFGNQPSGLNADSEGVIRMWYDTVKARQEDRNRDVIQRVVDLVQLELFGEIIDDIVFDFKDLWQLDAAGKAAIQLTKAQVIETDIASGVISPEEGRLARAKDGDSPYEGLDLEASEAPGEEIEEEQEAGTGEGSEGGLFDPEPQTSTSGRLQRSVEGQAAEFGGAATGGFSARDEEASCYREDEADDWVLAADDATWSEADHPRGQPGNAGQFAEKGQQVKTSKHLTKVLSKYGYKHKGYSPGGHPQYEHPSGAKVYAAPSSPKQHAYVTGFRTEHGVHYGTGPEALEKILAGKHGEKEESEQPPVASPSSSSKASTAGEASTAGGAVTLHLPFGAKVVSGPVYGKNVIGDNVESYELKDGYQLHLVSTGKWRISNPTGKIVAYGTGQQALNEAFEALHPRDASGKFIAKPGEMPPDQDWATLAAELEKKGFKKNEVQYVVGGATFKLPVGPGVLNFAANGHWEIVSHGQPLNHGDDMASAVKFAQSFAESYPEQSKPKPEPKNAIGSTLNFSSMKQVGPQLGSNPGGQYEDSDGKVYYIKQPEDVAHARNELLAARLFGLAGGDTLKYHQVVDGHKLYVGTDMAPLEANNVSQLTAEQRAQAKRDFALHAWLANWDAVGLSGDNIGVVDGKVVSLDFGGSLMYRAKGSPKGSAFDDKASEFSTLRDKGKNPTAAALYGDMTDAELQDSAKRLDNVSSEFIRDAVTAYAPGDATQKQGLADKLIARRDSIIAQAFKQKPEQPESQFVEKSGSFIWKGEPYKLLADAAPLATKAEAAAISKYSGGDYVGWNDTLRSSFGEESGDYPTAELRGYLEKASFPETRVVHRRVSMSFAKYLLKEAVSHERGGVVGGAHFTFEDYGFVSSDHWSGELTCRITVPKGAQAAAIGPYSKHPGELEVLIQAGSKFRVTAINVSEKTVDMELVRSGSGENEKWHVAPMSGQ